MEVQLLAIWLCTPELFTECSVRSAERKGLIGEVSRCESQHDVFNILSYNWDISVILPLQFTSTCLIPLDINYAEFHWSSLNLSSNYTGHSKEEKNSVRETRTHPHVDEYIKDLYTEDCNP
jgi:hypothetical protein